MSDLKTLLDSLQQKARNHAKRSTHSKDDSRLIVACADRFLDAAACIEWLKKEFPDEYRGN